MLVHLREWIIVTGRLMEFVQHIGVSQVLSSDPGDDMVRPFFFLPLSFDPTIFSALADERGWCWCFWCKKSWRYAQS